MKAPAKRRSRDGRKVSGVFAELKLNDDGLQRAHARARWGNLEPRLLVFLTIYATCGNITCACRQLGTSRAMHYDWLTVSPAYAAAFAEAAEAATEMLVDFLVGRVLSLTPRFRLEAPAPFRTH